MSELDLSVGATASRQLTVTTDHVKQFAEITGDYNPLHFDEDCASRTKFERLVAQCGITTGLLHTLATPQGGGYLMRRSWCWKLRGMFHT